ncbi:MAG: acetyltransferase [Candidatus Didemnitutus sp.]|nr:acetyltransferase [Candidatus Didemnitutus sp.]
MKKLIIIGAGGFGREVLAWAKQSHEHGREWTIKGFLDDNPDAVAGKNVTAPVLGKPSEYQPTPEDVFVCAIGTPAAKQAVQESLAAKGGVFINIVHPTAVLGENVQLGAGVILCPQVVVTVNAVIGDGVALNLQTIVGHDAVIGKWCQISPHCDILGYAQLGDGVFMGSHAVVLPSVKIGANAILGAGAIASRDIPTGSTAVGIPAKPR